jgi:predicted DCC family thiol-disulfide oxidoreductase YuxK
MAKTEQKTIDGNVWFAYDGHCPICTHAASALQIRKSVGPLQLVDARDDPAHPLIQEIARLGLNLDDGMVLKYQCVCYHGEDALHMMAMLGSPSGWFNRANVLLFRSRAMAKLCYPAMRGARNLLLHLKGVEKIRNLQNPTQASDPIFKSVFGEDWNSLPMVMRDHYAIRPFSDDVVIVKGTLDIEVPPFMGLVSRLSGMLVSRSGTGVPVTVTFKSGRDTSAFHFDRVFHYPGGDEHFRSHMVHIDGDQLVEFMRFGIGWKMAYSWDGAKIILSHRGYVWRILGVLIPIPLALFIGRGEAEELPISSDEFEMWTHACHPWFGKSFAYSGPFKITKVSCPAAS